MSPATHFATGAGHSLNSVANGSGPAMIAAATLAGVPAWLRDTFGDKIVEHANVAARLDVELIENEDCFIPQTTLSNFLYEVEQRTCEEHFGLMLAPYLSFESYGLWADYCLGAASLGEAISRASSTLGYHSYGDRMDLSVSEEVARLRYFNATRGQPGYAHIAIGTAGVLLDLVRCWLGQGWTPSFIELDMPRPARATDFEDCFQCPVHFEAESVSVCFDPSLLNGYSIPRQTRHLLTTKDLARLRFSPQSFGSIVDATIAQIWVQVLAGEPDLETTAHALHIGERSLQRRLRQENLDYRTLVNSIRAERASEILIQTNLSITEISSHLGYSSPANFARAFRKTTGHAPDAYRRKGLSSYRASCQAPAPPPS